MSLIGKSVMFTGFVPPRQTCHIGAMEYQLYLQNVSRLSLVVEIRQLCEWETSPKLFGIFRRKVK